MERIAKNNCLWVLSTVAFAILLLSGIAKAVTEDTAATFRMNIEVDNYDGTFIIEEDGRTSEFEFLLQDARVRDGSLFLSPDLKITSSGIAAGQKVYPLENLRVNEIYEEDDHVIGVELKYRKIYTGRHKRRTSRNRIAVGKKLVVEHDDFVRGDVICFGGNIEINGEINRNVVAFLGDVLVKSDGIVRGNIVAMDGKVNLRGDAAAYGQILAHHGQKKSRRARTRHGTDEWGPRSLDLRAWYNRVDGLHLGCRFAVADPDSILPTFFAGGGYSLAADRWQYEIGVHQRVFDKYSFSAGGNFFRQTSTDDYWLSPRRETSVLAFLVAEDPLDYYEEEGGRVYITFNPGYYNEFGASYRYTDLRWMRSYPKLWSVFGWGKDFRSNFSSVPDDILQRHKDRDEFDSNLGQLSVWYNLDTRDDEEDIYSGWWANLLYETAGDKLKGSLAFDRFTAEVRRYQPISYRQNVNVRIKYGTSGRDVPLFKAFYLGGWRTVRGLKHKSLIGEQMILGNLEYVINFPWLSFETSLLFDVGKVTDRKDNIFSNEGFHSSVGLRVGFEERFSLEVAKSLDDSDESIKLWALFQKSF